MHPAQASLFAALGKGQSLGKKVDMLVVNDLNVVSHPPMVDILQIRNHDDGAAMNLQVTIVPPRIIPVVPAPGGTITLAEARSIVDRQAASGTVDNLNAEISAYGGIYTPITALVDWGIGGAQAESVEVDASNGLCLNLSASFCRVRAGLDPLLKYGIGVIGPNAIYELAAFVGPGYAKRNNAQRTIRFPDTPGDDIGTGGGNNGTTQVVPIPKMATRVRLMVGPGEGANPVTLRGWTAQVIFLSYYADGFTVNPPVANWAGAVVACPLAVDNGNVGEWEIPNGAYYAAVYHNNSFPIAPSLVFDLGI